MMKSAGISREQAETDLCRALSDGDIEVRIKLAKHSFRLQTSSEDPVGGSDLQIPTQLKPSDFDWQRSRPIRPWFISKRSPRHGGQWYLEWIEVSAKHVMLLHSRPCSPVDDLAPATKLKRKTRTRPIRSRAKDGLNACYPDGVPAQDVVPNDELCGEVLRYLKRNGQPAVSSDTILREAGRRK